MNDQVLQKIFILYCGRAANTEEISFLNSVYEEGGIPALEELVNQTMGNLAAQEGEVAILQTIAKNGVGITLDTAQATEILASLRAQGLNTWAEIFTFAATSQESFGQTLNNRAQAASALLEELKENGQQDFYQGAAVESAVTTLLQNIGSSDNSLANGINGVQAFASSLSANGIKGKVVDGYISGATVFADANGDGDWNEGEWKSTTDSLGNYDLPANTQGAIIAYGGIDILTGKAFQGQLKAPEGATQVNPLTTLIQSMVANGQAASIQGATNALKASLGLSESVNLLTYDPLAVLDDDDASDSDKDIALAVQSKALQVANIIAQGAAGLGGLKNADAITTAIGESIKNTSAGSTLDLGSSDAVKGIITQAATSAKTGTTSEQAEQIAQIIGASNTSAGSATSLLSLAQAATIAQGTASDALNLGLSKGDFSDAVTNFTGDSLNIKVQQIDPNETSSYFSPLPVIVSSATADAIAENGDANQQVYQVIASHETDLSYSLKSVGDDEFFSIDATTGIVTMKAPADYEEKDDYQFTVVAKDSEGNAGGLYVNLAITDVNETAPTASLDSDTMNNTGRAVVQSSETGSVYLVNSNIGFELTSIDLLTDDNSNQWNKVAITTADQDALLSSTGLIEGTYKAYAIDAEGNLSEASSNTVTIDSIAPSVSATGTTTYNSGKVIVNSTEIGTAYLVHSDIVSNDSSLSERDITRSDNERWNKVAISAAGTDTELAATGLANGTYYVYATDAAGNLSGASTQAVRIISPPPPDTTAPTASVTFATISNAGDAVVQSSETGTAYLVNNSITVNSLTDITGAADNQWNQVTISSVNQDTNLAATELADGTYHVYTLDGSGNLSVISSNSVSISTDNTAPTASVTTATINDGNNAIVQSTEIGTAYLVNDNVTVTNEVSVTGAADNQWNQTSIATINQDTTLAATGLAEGTYHVFAIDAAGNLSATSGNSVTIDSTAPSASATTATIANTDDAVVQSDETGTAYLVNDSITVNGLADITGAADSQWNSVAISTANQDTNLAATGLADGTYKVYTVDAAGNLGTASSNTVTIVSAVTDLVITTSVDADLATDLSGGTYRLILDFDSNDYSGADITLTGFGADDFIAFEKSDGQVQTDTASQSNTQINGSSVYKWHSQRSGSVMVSTGKFDSIGVNVDDNTFNSAMLRSFTTKLPTMATTPVVNTLNTLTITGLVGLAADHVSFI